MEKIKKRVKREKAGLGIRAGLTGNKVCAECKYWNNGKTFGNMVLWSHL